MKYCLYIHQDCQPQKLSRYLFDKRSCEHPQFQQVLYAKFHFKTMPNEFYACF